MTEVCAAFDHDGKAVVIRPFVTGDEDGFVDCFNAIFLRDNPGVPACDRALVDWKFSGVAAGGRREAVVAELEGQGIIGAYASQPLRIWLDGEERRSAQVTDLMVIHELRRIGPRPGLFVHLGKAFNSLYCGKDPDQQIFHYGWPVPNWRAGQRFLGYENLRDWNCLGHEIHPDPAFERPLPEGLELREVERFGEDADQLFDQLKAGMGLTLVKDSCYLNWRFADHPRREYSLYECRDRASGELRALMVYTVGDFRRAHTSWLVDWLVRPDDQDAIQALVGTAERRARADGTGVIAGVWSPVDPRFVHLQRMGWELWDTTYFLAIVNFGRDMRFLRDNWLFTMGDSDLI